MPTSVKARSFFACLAFALIFSVPAFAAQSQQGAPRAPAASESNAVSETDSAAQAAARAAIKAGATAISVDHEGTDTLGSKLAFQLKEIFNAGTLFSLNDQDEPKLKMLITTAVEFPARPEVGSVYDVVWVYSERSNVLSNYLAHEVGVATPEGIQTLADRLAARTAGIAAKHSYVFRK